jgi:hypothetical protein
MGTPIIGAMAAPFSSHALRGDRQVANMPANSAGMAPHRDSQSSI